MVEPDDSLDEEAESANRHDVRGAVIVGALALVTVIVSSVLVVIGGMNP